MKIHKALKVKNRLAGELARLQEIFKRENSRRCDNPSTVDREKVFQDIQTTASNLSGIKASIARANTGICGKLQELSQAKADINFLNSLPCREGEEITFVGRDQEKLTYKWTAHLNREAIDKLVSAQQGVINNLQDEIDTYNAETEVDWKE